MFKKIRQYFKDRDVVLPKELEKFNSLINAGKKYITVSYPYFLSHRAFIENITKKTEHRVAFEIPGIKGLEFEIFNHSDIDSAESIGEFSGRVKFRKGKPYIDFDYYNVVYDGCVYTSTCLEW